MERITKAFLLAALLIGPFEAFAQSDSNITSVPSKKNKKKRGSSRAKKAVPESQSEAPAPSGEMALPLPQAPMEGPAAQVAPAAPPAPAVEVASANPTPQQPSFASTMPSTVELVPEREHRGLLMIAPKAGLFKSTTALEAAFYSGIELGLATPLFNHHFAMVFELDWVPPHYSGTIADPRVPSGSGSDSVHCCDIARARWVPSVPSCPWPAFGPRLPSACFENLRRWRSSLGNAPTHAVGDADLLGARERFVDGASSGSSPKDRSRGFRTLGPVPY